MATCAAYGKCVDAIRFFFRLWQGILHWLAYLGTIPLLLARSFERGRCFLRVVGTNMDGKTPGVVAAFNSCFQVFFLVKRRHCIARATGCALVLTLVGFLGCAPFGGAYSDSGLDRYPHVVDSKTFEQRTAKKAAAAKPPAVAKKTAEPTAKAAATEPPVAKTAPVGKAPPASAAKTPPPTAAAMARRAKIPNIAITELLAELSEKEGASEADLSMFRDFLSEHPSFADQMLALKNEAAGGFSDGKEPDAIPETAGAPRKKLEPGDRVGPAPAIGDASAVKTAPPAAPTRVEAKYPPVLARTDAPPALSSETATPAPATSVSATSSNASPPAAPPSTAQLAQEAVATTAEIAAASNEQPVGLEPEFQRNWREHLDAAIEALEQQRQQDYLVEGVTPQSDALGKSLLGKEAGSKSRAEVQLRLLYLLAGRSEEAAAPIKQLAENSRTFWNRQISGLSLYLDEKGSPDPDRRAALALRELRKATKALSKDSVLDVRNLAFCSHVQSFGAFTEFPDYRFRPNQETLLYAEVENFVVEKKSAGYETTLQASYQIFDLSGRRVAEHTFPVENELCRNHRRDFFVPFRVYMPKRLNPGDYTLQLTVEDVKGKKFGQGLIEFAIE